MDNDKPQQPDNQQPGNGQTTQNGLPANSGQSQPLPPTIDGQISKGESEKYVVKVDQGLCIGAASCVALAPKIFQLNQDNKACVVDPNGDTEENLKAAAQSCPVNAIILENKESGKQEYP